MENHNDIDKLFSDESAKDEADTKFPAFEKVWNEVEHRLDRKDNRGKIFRIWLPYAIAASFAVIFGSLYFFNFMKHDSEKPQIVENVASKKTEIAKENLQNLAEISSNSKIENVEKLNKKIQENIKKNPLKTNDILAYQTPKVAPQNNFFKEKTVSPTLAYSVSEIQSAPVPKAEVSEIAPEKSDSSNKEKDINEVVVTAYGTKKMKTGDYAKVSSEQVAMKISDSAQESVNFAMNDMELRETDKSAAKNFEPIYIVDGYIANAGFLQNFDVKKIYSLNIVDGKSAEKFYGKDGKKGIVLITTKGLSAKEERKLQEISKNYNLSGKVN